MGFGYPNIKAYRLQNRHNLVHGVANSHTVKAALALTRHAQNNLSDISKLYETTHLSF